MSICLNAIYRTSCDLSIDWIISMPASGLDFALTKLLSVSLGLWLAQLWLIIFIGLCDGWLRCISSTCPSSIACRGLCLTHPAIILELGHFWNLSLLNIVNKSLCFICDKMKDIAITCFTIKVVRRQWSPHSHACTCSWQIEFAVIWMSFPKAFTCLNILSTVTPACQSEQHRPREATESDSGHVSEGRARELDSPKGWLRGHCSTLIDS